MRGGRGPDAGRPDRLLLAGPAGVLLAGLLVGAWIQPSARMELERPLSAFPESLAGHAVERELEIPEEQLAVLRPDDHLVRRYGGGEGAGFELFVAYYGKQLEGATIHSPRNCLPGSGWEPVQHRRVPLETEAYDGTVNRYVVQNRRGERALVYYWYQGRGRIAANEYRVKWDLLRDALVMRRTDEALVRLVFPAGPDGPPDPVRARTVAASVAGALAGHLPSG